MLSSPPFNPGQRGGRETFGEVKRLRKRRACQLASDSTAKRKQLVGVNPDTDCYTCSFNFRGKSLILKQGNTFSINVAL